MVGTGVPMHFLNFASLFICSVSLFALYQHEGGGLAPPLGLHPSTCHSLRYINLVLALFRCFWLLLWIDWFRSGSVVIEEGS